MPTVWKECRGGSKGEQRLARQLCSFEDPDLILCFSIDFIPGGREIDLLIAHKKYGVFIIEVKAIPLHALTSVAPNSWVIEGRGSDESPLSQAYKQYEGLRNFWGARVSSKLPHIATTACFPEISRSEWVRGFAGSTYPESIADGMIFREDLVDAKVLAERLKHVMCQPPMRKGREPWPPHDAFLQAFYRLLQPSAPNVATMTDRLRLSAIEKSITHQLRGEFPVGGAKFCVFTGTPGTGKTFRLLSIGLLHAYEKRKVLFVCFNKTLASDIRRLLSFEGKLRHVQQGVECLDVNQLARRCFDLNGLPFQSSGSADDWGKMVVQHLKQNRETAIIERYDLLLIDEAHDMQDWQLDLLKLHAAPVSTICMAMGKGQELYRDESAALEWLKTQASTSPVQRKELRKNFRNTSEQYFAAIAFHKAWPDKLSEVGHAYAQTFPSGRQRTEIEFDRSGEPLQYIPIPALPGEFDDCGSDQASLVSEEFADILSSEIDAIALDDNAHPVGMLVLVPDQSSSVATWVRLALSAATRDRKDVSFIDYTDDKAKRSEAKSTEIRLCTYHSSRGLEGERVIIFGLENIDAFAKSTNVKPENLGFIALSRGIFRTVVVARTFFNTNTHVLLKEIFRVQDADHK